ncbi:FAD-binding oxidoreductase [Mycobacterium intracellulare]|uniref:FAD-linked oxidase C-terminal domain-containing protein n=1 Tax=Mycobacterium intracellulare subsp. chimaera TaxID=222805 RepID=A0A7U5RVD8_MYCIT|nr:FAD-linked oxidase C-terminal domain-containing protein [Mycobacterium intracellulare]ASL14801.1 putative dehydrogenase [Mycobacterium intracellulare subsp. chimaera]ASQ86001.1 FAD-binding oxidoreductase [Mycobacterium intracellulare subsp. chimaera]MCF1815754.1 FAD-binding protein [Mycobacterium intracellulare subsp. intracellulare]MDM3928277.1 FAD-linked oxidase C-terminal domain-containing protein [Mycobacterium intracellulare subsp. chimaera]MDS0334083.1 FAD-binding protein [Mycobacteri
MTDMTTRFATIVGAHHILTGDAISDDYAHDEVLTKPSQRPAYLAKPATADEVAQLLKAATENHVPVTARGSGTGLSGAAIPRADGLLISFERMNAVLEVDVTNQVAVVQPGVTLTELDAATAGTGLRYMVHPGELSSSVGGNVGTNAGGMRAVKYGIARHNVLGLQAALPTGEIIRTGGKIAKVSTGYDLTQLIVGSEGTLALATEVIVKLHPRLDHSATVLAPFADFDQVMQAVPKILASGMAPYILEYIDNVTMAALVHTQNLELGVPDDVRDSCQAYLVVALENRTVDRLDEDVETTGELLAELGAVDAYVLDGGAARKLIEAREKAFWTLKAVGADDLIDAVVPRGAMPKFLSTTRELATAAGGAAAGCGHAGDGNVHLAIFCPDAVTRKKLLTDIFALAMELGGAISGEHGLGRAKAPYFVELEDPVKVDLMRRIKAGFDPAGILNPDVVFASGDA